MKMENNVKPNDNNCKLHSIKYYNLSPRAINYMAPNYELMLLAITRDDASIEIWKVSDAVRLEKVIANVPGASIESLIWVKNRLFSGGLAGDITEWDLKHLCLKSTTLVTGNSVWCLDGDKNQNQIVAGTEEGFLNVFNVNDNEIVYDKILDKQEGRILCCKFDYTGNVIVTGSVDAIRIWNKNTGHVIHKMSTGRSEKGKETVVWSVYVFKDLTIASGDSRGRLTLWDGNLGAQIDSYTASKADILCITASNEEDQLFCSGVDPIVKTYTYTTIKKDNQKTGKWVETFKKTYHLNDVKTMACFKSQLITGSVDGNLIASSRRTLITIQKCPPFIQNPVVVCDTLRLTLFKYINYIEIWRLGDSNNKDGNETGFDENEENEENIVALTETPQKLLALKSRNEETILSATISSNGKWIVYTTNSCIRIFKFELNENDTPTLTQLKNVPEEFGPCNKVLFSKDSKMLFLYRTSNVIDIFEILRNDIDYKQTIELAKFIKDVVYTMIIDNSGKYLVCAGLCGNIGVWTLQDNGQWSHYINLPKYKTPATTLAIRPNSLNVAAVFSDNKIFEYNLENMEFAFSAFIAFPFSINNSPCVVEHISFDPRNENILILAYNSFVGVLSKVRQDLGACSTAKRSKNLKPFPNHSQIFVKTIKSYDHLIHLSWLNESELIVTEVNPNALVEQLPPALRRKLYGVS